MPNVGYVRHNVVDWQGNVVENALVNIYEHGTTTPVDIFDLDGNPIVQPLVSDERGGVRCFIDELQHLDLVIDDNSGTATLPALGDNTVTFDPFTVEFAATPTVVGSGGGGGGGSDADLADFWINDYGAQATPGFDNGDAIRDTMAAASAAGGGKIRAKYSTNAYEFSGEILQPAYVNVHGPGKDLLVFQNMDYESEWKFGDHLAGYEGSKNFGFTIYGNHVARRVASAGVVVSQSFSDIRIHASITNLADLQGSDTWKDTAVFTLIGTQNCLFEQFTAEDGLVPIRFDGACATNVFVRPHFRTAYETFIDFSAEISVPAVGAVPGWNVFLGGIAEYDMGCNTFVSHRCGLDNVFDNFVFYITNAGDTFAGDTLIDVYDDYGLPFGFSTLRIRGSLLGNTPVGNTIDAVNAHDGGWVRFEDGNRVIGFRYGLRGFVHISGQQYPGQMGTAFLDESGLVYPIVVQRASTNVIRPGAASIVWASFVDGENFPRAYQTVNGAIGMGDGTANPTDFIYWEDGIGFRTNAAFDSASTVSAATGTPGPVAMGDIGPGGGFYFSALNVSVWPDASGKLRIMVGIPSTLTDGTVVGTQT